jgi:hypothetical protein
MTSDNHEPVTVYVAQGRLEAEIVRGRLTAANIPSMLAFESVGQVYGLTLDGLGQVLVKVPHRFAAEAAALLSDETSID